MTVHLYNCSSASNVIGKSFTPVQLNITATAKGNIDIDNPVLLLDYSASNFNYFYITDFGRYYYVTSRNLMQGSHIQISGASDPLESFINSIGSLECLIVRNEDPQLWNRYLADPSIPIPADPQYEVIEGEEIISPLSSGMYVIGVV